MRIPYEDAFFVSSRAGKADKQEIDQKHSRKRIQYSLQAYSFGAPPADAGKERADYFGINAQDSNAESIPFYAPSLLQKKDVKECQQDTESRSIVSISKKDNKISKNKLSGILQPAFYYTKEDRELETSSRLKELKQICSGGLHDFPQSERRIYAYIDPQIMQKIFEPLYVYKDTAPCYNVDQKSRYSDDCLFRRLAYIGTNQRNMSQKHNFSSKQTDVTRIQNQDGKIVTYSNAITQTFRNDYQLKKYVIKRIKRQDSKSQEESWQTYQEWQSSAEKFSEFYWQGTSDVSSTTSWAFNAEKAFRTK
ncbi:hypothetical protein BB561_005879 [Smittium simulii]|uniref:Uncharacterized protein n=1 Tax=Smittium simulii TaxID=133385 RepID=A0A2T9Y7U1_9FUNG|nr:hypothetical protein BB561_005879 [Smittium simulii]